MFKVKLQLNDEEYKSSGKTLLEALRNLKQPGIIKTTGIIWVTDGERSLEKGLNIPKLKSLFNDHNDIYREIMAKNLSLFLK